MVDFYKGEITIPVSTLMTVAFGLFVTIVFLIGVIAYWRARIYRSEAARLKEEAEREKRTAVEERTKAELVLEETKRYGRRPDRNPVSGKWGRLGYAKGQNGGNGSLGPAGPSESEILRNMLEIQAHAAERMERRLIRLEFKDEAQLSRMVALFKEIMSR